MDEESELEGLAPWVVLLLTLFGGGLRVYMTGYIGLNMQETLSVWLANHSIPNLLHWVVTIDANPPLYYLLLHYWMIIRGDTPYNARLLSVLFGAATIPIIYLIGKRISSVKMGLAAALLLAISPFNIRLAHEARMYTLLGFNAAVAICALARLLTDHRTTVPIGSQFREYIRTWRTPGQLEAENKEFSYQARIDPHKGIRGWISRHRWLPIQSIETDIAWIVLIVFTTATMLSHNSAVLFPITINLFVFGLILYQRAKKQGSSSTLQAPSLSNWLKAQLGIFLLWSPWIYGFSRQAGRTSQELSPTRLDFNTIVQVLSSFLNAPAQTQPGQAVLIWILYALVLGLGLVHYRKRIASFLFLATLFALPIICELVASQVQPIFLDRTLIWATIPLMLLLAAGIAQLRFRVVILIVTMIFAFNNLFTAVDYFRNMPREDWSDVAGYVANYAQKGDLILFNATWMQVPFDYTFVDYEARYLIKVEKHGVPSDLFDRGILEPKMTDEDISRLDALLKGHRRVWLVYNHDQRADPLGLIPQTLATKMKLIQQRDYWMAHIELYTTP